MATTGGPGNRHSRHQNRTGRRARAKQGHPWLPVVECDRPVGVLSIGDLAATDLLTPPSGHVGLM